MDAVVHADFLVQRQGVHVGVFGGLDGLANPHFYQGAPLVEQLVHQADGAQIGVDFTQAVKGRGVGCVKVDGNHRYLCPLDELGDG